MELSFWKEVISEDEKTCKLTYVYTYSIKTNAEIPAVYEGYRVVQVEDEVWKKLMEAITLTIPAGIERVGTYSYSTPKLKKLCIDDLDWYLTAGGPHHNVSGYSLYELFLGDKVVHEVIYPRQVTKVMDWQFYGCSSLETVLLHDEITEIGTLAFSRTNLQSVVIPGSVKRLHGFAFKSCSKLERVEIGEGVEELESAFGFCPRLREVYLPASLHKLEFAFYNCSPDLTIHFPSRAAFDQIDMNDEDREDYLQFAVFDDEGGGEP